MNIKKDILKLLTTNREGLTISDVTRQMKIHYITASKYLYILEAEGKIFYRPIGMAKLFRIRRRWMR